jgi:hypothetical protein
MTKIAISDLPYFTISVSGTPVQIELNQDYLEILEDLRYHVDDISHTEESSYHESSTIEVLFCRCMEYLKDLIAELSIHAAEGNLLAQKHLADASVELEWCLVNPAAIGDEDECAFTDSTGVHQFYLRNPSDAAKELWEIPF